MKKLHITKVYFSNLFLLIESSTSTSQTTLNFFILLLSSLIMHFDPVNGKLTVCKFVL